MNFTSGGEKAWRWIAGYSARIQRQRSSQQPIGRSGWTPPWSRIPVPRSASVSSIFRPISSYDSRYPSASPGFQ